MNVSIADFFDAYCPPQEPDVYKTTEEELKRFILTYSTVDAGSVANDLDLERVSCKMRALSLQKKDDDETLHRDLQKMIISSYTCKVCGHSFGLRKTLAMHIKASPVCKAS
jgi:rubrerythrin